jgi:hypothetical protein
MSIKGEIVKAVLDFYRKSHDFNGLPVSQLGGDKMQLAATLKELIQEDSVIINFGDRHPNPHILAFEPEDIQKELSKFEKYNLASACLYPSRSELSKVIPEMELADQPYTRLLKLGEPQLALQYFDLSVLESYRNDPRFDYKDNDAGGSISIKAENYDNPSMRSEDKTFLRTFGFGYSRDMQMRIVAAFVRYLSEMSPEHQQIWKAKELHGNYFAHPDYIRVSSGRFPERVSIFVAVTEELRQTNHIAKLIGREPLFNQDFCDDNRPREFGFLLRPTLKEYYNFALLLDKMLSENINRAFFKNEVDYECESIEKDDRIRIVPLNSIKILENWLAKYYKFEDPKLIQQMIAVFRKIRKERMSPAHKIEEDKFDMEILARQRALIKNTYEALRTLRRILMKYPGAEKYSVPEWLQQSKFWIG